MPNVWLLYARIVCCVFNLIFLQAEMHQDRNIFPLGSEFAHRQQLAVCMCTAHRSKVHLGVVAKPLLQIRLSSEMDRFMMTKSLV